MEQNLEETDDKDDKTHYLYFILWKNEPIRK